ncbi:MAG: cadherin-like domain-containing protein [Pirellulaceae bacterium]
MAEGSTGTVITTAMLRTTDVDNADAQLSYTVDAVPTNGTLRLSGAALSNGQTFTQDDIDAGNVTYDHDGSQTSTDSFDFTVDDGQGTDTSSTFNFTITNVNDPPINTVPGAQSVNEDALLAISGITVADADDNLSTVQLTVNNGVLTVTLSGGASVSTGANGSNDLTLSGSIADINATLASLTYQGNLHFNGSDTLTVLSTDGGSATDSDAVAITVNAVNDTPDVVGPGSAYSVNEQTNLNIHGTGFSVSDIDASTGTMTASFMVGEGTLSLTAGDSGVSITANNAATVSFTGTLAQINALLTSTSTGTIIYSNGSDTPPASTTITLTVNDGGNTGVDPGLTADGSSEGDLASQTINITAVNDEQVLGTNTGATVAEGSSGNTITTAMLETTDVDNADSELVYTVTSVPANGTLRLSGSVRGLGSTFTQADIDAGLVTYDHDGSQTSGDAFSFTIDDGSGTTSSGTFNFTVTNVNDAPVEATIEGTPLAYAENDGAVAITSTLTVTDVDDTNMESAVIQITGNYANGEDVLAFVDQNGITGSWNATNGTLTQWLATS